MAEKTLDVPLFTQDKDSMDCVIASVRMILKYYGVDKTVDDIKRDVYVDPKEGVIMPQVGSYFLDNGFDAEIITMNPMIIARKSRDKTQTELMEHFRQIAPTAETAIGKKAIEYFVEFMEKGGIVTIRIPSIKDITDEIMNERPLIAFVTTGFLWNDKPDFNFHANVVVGIGDGFVKVNDPKWDLSGGRHTYPVDEFMYMIHSTAHGGEDAASIMLLKKR